MPATRDLKGSICSVEMENEWKKEEGESLSGWGSPPSVAMENEESVSEQLQHQQEENQGAHFNYAHFGVGRTLSIHLLEDILRTWTQKHQPCKQDPAQYPTPNL